MSTVAEIHNSGMTLLNDLVAWTDVYILTADNKQVPIKALISKNESAYLKSDSIDTKDYKLCKILIDNIVEANTTYNLNIPIPPSSIKAKKAKIIINRGTPYQIRTESTGSFNGRKMWVLDIERDN